VQHGMRMISVLVYRKSMHFSQRYVPKTIFRFLPVTLTFNLKTALPVTAQMGDLLSQFERCTEFLFQFNCWHVTDGQMDERTDRQTDVIHNAAS